MVDPPACEGVSWRWSHSCQVVCCHNALHNGADALHSRAVVCCNDALHNGLDALPGSFTDIFCGDVVELVITAVDTMTFVVDPFTPFLIFGVFLLRRNVSGG